MPLKLINIYQQSQLKMLLNNLRTLNANLKTSVTREGNLFHLKVGREKIAIVSVRRWTKYRNGIADHTERLARRYGILSRGDRIAGQTIIDIGANIGELALFCERAGAQVFAIEPDPVNYLALEKNIAGTSIKAFQVALWEKEQTLTFYSSVERADSSLIQPTEHTHTLRVQAIPLDRFIETQGINQVYLIKADAEGAEPEVLRGAEKALRCARFVSIDCGPERKGEKTFDVCQQILAEMGYETKTLDVDGSVLFGVNKHPQQQPLT